MDENNTPGRLMGLDVGLRRIGIAVSDLLGITAQGLPTLQRKNKRSDFAELERVIAEQNVREVVVGYPLNMRGDEGRQAKHIQEFAEELRKRFAGPVHLWDERLSTAEAQRVLKETDMTGRRRGQVVDQMAAVLILQSFMEARALRKAQESL